MNAQHIYNLHAQLPDIRDHEYEAPEGIVLPTEVDYRPICIPAFDQLQLGSCTSQSAIFALWFAAHKQGEQAVMLSRLMHYYLARSNKRKDTGSTVRQSVKVAVKYGVCPETEWPYDITQFTKKPPQACYDDAAQHEAKEYKAVAQDMTTMKTCLASGYPILIGFTVYTSFESQAVASTGIMPLPQKTESVLGGHAVSLVGYQDDTQCFIARNSWSASWGDNGYFYMPYEYALSPKLSTDFWMIQTVS
jgi:C1A family cysteine protease